MTIVSWLKSNRKDIICHALILAGFLLFIFFVAEPIFNSVESVETESKLHEFTLPSESSYLLYNIDSYSIDKHITLEGWAAIPGEDSLNSQLFIVLKCPEQTYIFDTKPVNRTDVTRHFKDQNLNLDYSGFLAFIPSRKLSDGTYVLGLYIKHNDKEALNYTDKIVIKSGNVIKLTQRLSTLQHIALPKESYNIRLSIDKAQKLNANGIELIEISGWAFINDVNANNSTIYVLLKSDSTTYIYDTLAQRRPGLPVYFKITNLNLEYSGFKAFIQSDELDADTYRIGIYIKNSNIESLRYSGNTVVITKE